MDPDGYMFYNTAITNAYYELLQKYLDDYEQEHGTPLLHDGGLINQPVRAKALIKRIKDNEDENNILPVVARVGIRPRVVL
ncbi:MAG: hypothetical protein ACLU4N_02855 [Butyricimonas faecihominis]